MLWLFTVEMISDAFVLMVAETGMLFCCNIVMDCWDDGTGCAYGPGLVLTLYTESNHNMWFEMTSRSTILAQYISRP